ncbi:MAG TPA: alpha/beta fold hydrolase [Rhizomicrobium sp.]|nr:alpha/beta fold hydrolase [Rhizomicrobium sp.]
MLARLALVAVLAMTGGASAAAFKDSEASLPTTLGTLYGTLVTPEKSSAVALILAGSGPTDRDGNSTMGIHPNTLKLLAGALGARGITTLRTDKRGIAQSADAMISESDLTPQTYADDAKAWVAQLRGQTGAKCIWLIGHSEGALIAEMAAQNNPDICGLVLASAPGRKLGDIIRAQINSNPANPADLKAEADNILNTLENGQTVADVPPVLAPLFRPSVQPYMIAELALDPAAMLGAMKLPVLIVQGDNDIQVSVDDAKALSAAEPDAKLVILPGVNHVLKQAPADRAENIATYNNPDLPIAPRVTDAITAFIASNP